MLILLKIFLIFVAEIVPYNKLNLVFMDCIRISFLRDGNEVTWFTNYDLSVFRKLIYLIEAKSYSGVFDVFVHSLKDLLKCSKNGD